MIQHKEPVSNQPLQVNELSDVTLSSEATVREPATRTLQFD
jgi:hypothetical protein